MMKIIITSLLALLTGSSHAQESKVAENQAFKPVVFEGNVTGVADSTIVYLSVRNGLSDSYSGCTLDVGGQDTIIGGKFRLMRYPQKENEQYYISVRYGKRGLNVYAYPGTTSTITGKMTRSMRIHNWRVNNNHPLTKEDNAYKGYTKKIWNGYDSLVNVVDQLPRGAEYDRISGILDSVYIARMYDFMKDREVNSVYIRRLLNVATYLIHSENQMLYDKLRKLYSRIPIDYAEDQFAVHVKKLIYPEYLPLHAGEMITDFKLFDHDGKEHHLKEFCGNGKYLLMEINSRTCKGCVEHRPIKELNEIYNNYSDKVDMLLVNCDDYFFWQQECKDPKKWGRDPWHEWNDNQGSRLVMERYGGVSGPCFVFIDPDGKMLGRTDSMTGLVEEVKKYFKL